MEIRRMDFIGEYEIDQSICDKIVEYFEEDTTFKKLGTTVGGYDANSKSSMDANLGGELKELYKTELQKCIDKYRTEYPFCDTKIDRWSLCEGINIQKYSPGQCFRAWHCERCKGTSRISRRFLVFMTYLNDVDFGGETEFFHQKRKFVPRKGKTLIWPCEWTHTHRGLESPTDTKYIVTGWFSFTNIEYDSIILAPLRSDQPPQGTSA